MIPVSVVVPARDEEAVIAKNLRALLEGSEPDEVELIVVCNGCSDRTAATARLAAPDAKVVELAEGSKTSALNEGDRLATRFPRLYVDADVELGIEALRATARVLCAPPVLCAAPFARYELTGRPWLVRRYFEVWQQLPYFKEERVGGVFALSAEGRSRFAEFPPVVADDQFVLQHFPVGERRCLPDHHFVVEAPRSVGALVTVRTRVYRGRRQLGTLSTPVAAPGGAAAALLRLARQPSMVPGVAAYAAISLIAKLRSRRQADLWERDASTREAAHGSARPPVRVEA